MAPVEIAEVVKADVDAEQLRGRNIEVPQTGGRFDGDTIYVVGWVLGGSSPAVSVEVVHDGTVLQSTPIDVRRPDVAAAFPDASEVEDSGFRTHVPVPNRDESELVVQAVLQDEVAVPLGSIQVRQRRGDEERYGERSAQDRPGPISTFFRRVLGRGGG